MAGSGYQVVISAGLDDDVRNDLINRGILIIYLPLQTLAKVKDTVGADPGIVLTVDIARGELRARGELLARFEIGHREQRPAEPAGHPEGGGRGGEAMARRLLMAQRLLSSASLPGDVRMRLQRRLVAICDAMKAPGADVARSARRLDRLFAELARTGQPGLAEAPGRPHPSPAQAVNSLSRSIRSGSGVDSP